MDRRLPLLIASLAAGHSVRLRLRGGSMAPAIADGQRVVVRPLGSSPLRAGEVVACDVLGQLRVHRVVRLEGEQVFTRGDANLRADPPLRREQILGRVSAEAGDLGWGRRLLRRLRYSDSPA